MCEKWGLVVVVLELHDGELHALGAVVELREAPLRVAAVLLDGGAEALHRALVALVGLLQLLRALHEVQVAIVEALQAVPDLLFSRDSRSVPTHIGSNRPESHRTLPETLSTPGGQNLRGAEIGMHALGACTRSTHSGPMWPPSSS